MFGIALDWLMSYINNRTFAIKSKSHTSNSYLLKIRIPQGSVLGPLLFLMQMGPLVDIIRNFTDVNVYADYIIWYTTLSYHASVITVSSLNVVTHFIG